MAGVQSEPITVTVAYHVAPGRESEFRSWAMTVLGTAARVPGYLGGGVLAPGEVGTEWHVIHRFDSAVSTAAWEESAARTRLASYGDQLARETGHRRIRGLRAWFEGPAEAAPPSPPRPPPKWKLWFVNMGAVFPPVLLFNLTVIPYLGGLNALVRTLILCLSVTAIVTWVLMPRLQRFLKKWLYPPLQAFRGRHKRRAA
ncbi:antibiotic biosynthesis monooxygenase [Streptomyces sp. NPDC096310]|uniref:antibiotic biosynthesis monooxygenase n=1 Tax=Streptomyces sp. NPDC096310 TaxID=3366082 RepID=UPI0038189C38